MSGQEHIGARASKFLAQMGTGGGPVGGMNTPGLVGFGAGDLQRQLIAGRVDPYAVQRMIPEAPVVGSPAHHMDPALNNAPVMPGNLSSGYLHLNQPGSPLPMYGLMADHNVKAAQITQDNLRAMDQRMLTGLMPLTGQLPISAGISAAQQLTAQAAKQRGR